MALLLPLDVGFLAHHADRFVGSLDLNGLDVTNRNSINHGSHSLFGLLTLDHHFLSSNRLGGEMTSAASVLESFVHTLGLSHGLVGSHDVLSRKLLGGLIGNSLELLILHLPRDSLSGVVRHRIVFISQKLSLDWLDRIINSVTDTKMD